MTCCCCSSYCRTFSLWICALLGLIAIQVAIDRTVQHYLGQAATGLLLMIVITVRYNPFDCCCPKKGCTGCKTRAEEEEEESIKVSATTTQVAKAKDAEETQEVVEPSEITGAASGDSSDSSTPLVEEEEGLVPPTVSPADDNPQEDSQTTSKPRPRLAFLDNLKSFLAALVVTLHVSCAFGACHGFWFLILGETSDPPFWAHATRQLSMLLQGFFMPLFFFVSACFVPTSLRNRTKESFYKAKRKRLYYPAMFVILTLVPLCAAIGNWMADVEPRYLCLPGHCWFNLWLLGLHWVYVTLTEARSRDMMGIQRKSSGEQAEDTKPIHDDPPTKRPFPSTFTRMASSMLICGVLLVPFLGVAGGITFAGMPMLNGSLTCDFYMYAVGVMASNNGWLERPLREQMDIPPWVHRCIVLVEAAAMVTLYQLYDLQRSINIGPAVGFFLISGMYTVDMGLMLVELFQTYMNTTNPCSRSFSKAAYTVYLIHPLVITSLSALMLQLPFLRDTITFEDSSTAGQFLHLLAPPGQGGEEYYIQSWLMLLVASQLVVWPLSWGIANIPFLSTIL